jgi:hypothetical protein
MCTFCGDGFRFETTYLSGPNAGQVKQVLHPIAAEFEELYSRPSSGSLTLATRDVSADDVWPDTGIYISQVMPDGTRRGRFGGYFPKNNGSGGGALTVAIESLDGFLSNRLLVGPSAPYTLLATSFGAGTVLFRVFKPTAPNVETPVYDSPLTPSTRNALPTFLVRIAKGNLEGEGITGVPTLNAVIGEPNEIVDSDTPFMVINQPWWDFKNIGQWIDEIVTAEDGPKYQLSHEYSNGFWATTMTFADTVGEARDYTLKSDREGWQYGLEVDGSDKASRVYGIGAGEEWVTQYSIAYDSGRDPDYPERQVTQAWKDQSIPANLDGLTKGYVADHRDPTTVPSMTVVGLPDYDPDAEGYDPQKGFPAPEICKPGDTYLVDIGYGAITVKDIRVRNLGVAWSLKEGAPVERTLAMQPVERPSLSVKTQTPAKPPGGTVPVTSSDPASGGGGATTADPWPKSGLLTNINVASLDEISGIEASKANKGFAWVFDDEQETPQVVLINMTNGRQAASFTPNPGVSAAPVGDPEAIRLARSTNTLVLADTGDNDLNRPTSGANQPHLLALPEPKGAGNKGPLPARRLPIRYPNSERVNVETLLIHPTTEQVYLVSKEATRARVFGYGTLSSMNTTNNTGTLVATMTLKNVSDGTHTWAGGFLLLRAAGIQNTQVYSATTWKRVGAINTPPMDKSEAIAVVSSCAFITTSEGPTPPLYQILIPKTYGATCATPAGPVGGGSTPSNPNITVPGQLINMSNWKLQLPI